MGKPTVGSLFAGVAGFDLGFERAGFETAWQVEIDPQCRQILEQHFPEAERFEDVTKCGAGNLKRVDVICGGFPCQDVSVAGQRAGLAGERTGLFYDAARILQELRPAWFVFENVPGLFSSNKGRDFAEVLRVLMVECGYGVCWRVLNSQFFGVAQRRRRVFIVGSLGRPCPPEILFEPEGSRRDSQAGSEAWERLAAPLTSGSRVTGNAPGRRREDDFNLVSRAIGGSSVSSGYRLDPNGENLIAAAVSDSTGHHGHSSRRGDGSDNLVAATLNSGGNAGGFRPEPGEHLVSFGWNKSASQTMRISSDTVAGLQASECSNHAVAYSLRSDPGGTGQGHNTTYHVGPQIDPDRMRGLAGISEGLDLLPAGQDSRRYRQLGNAVTVSVAQWIGERILEHEKACTIWRIDETE